MIGLDSAREACSALKHLYACSEYNVGQHGSSQPQIAATRNDVWPPASRHLQTSAAAETIQVFWQKAVAEMGCANHS
ncbi:hypothetical protein [uncultured Rhodoblastus sp.]|uniref:hypothetical protein n=1 Tax=uncultured Rhodoblastus sp. TaxID=543037 RepID=UPI0025FAF889|nr:hypothetical protein [uncultured Rhodoblastus sp.]